MLGSCGDGCQEAIPTRYSGGIRTGGEKMIVNHEVRVFQKETAAKENHVLVEEEGTRGRASLAAYRVLDSFPVTPSGVKRALHGTRHSYVETALGVSPFAFSWLVNPSLSTCNDIMVLTRRGLVNRPFARSLNNTVFQFPLSDRSPGHNGALPE